MSCKQQQLVGVVRREINGKVLFLYADDLNCTSTEQHIKTILQHKKQIFTLIQQPGLIARTILIDHTLMSVVLKPYLTSFNSDDAPSRSKLIYIITLQAPQSP